MPFRPNHLTEKEVEDEYNAALKAIELRELRGWINRVVDPASEPQLEALTGAREALERDLAASRLLWAESRSEEG